MPVKTHDLSENLKPLNDHMFKEQALDELVGSEWSSSWQVATADIDNDGFVDIILSNEGSTNQPFLNNQNGGFQLAGNLPGGELDTKCIIAADINNDGNIDIIVGNARSDNLLLVNKGGGKFQSPVVLPGGSEYDTWSLAAADFNGDGMLDLVIGNQYENRHLLINDGKGNFTNAVILPVDNHNTFDFMRRAIMLPYYPRAIVTADFDNDGDIDTILINDRMMSQMLLNNGDGNFTKGINLPSGMSTTTSLGVGDFNRDGLMDLIIGNYDYTNQLLINKGEGNFEVSLKFPVDVYDTESVAVADLNNDGNLDLVIGNRYQQNSLLLNDGDGNFEHIQYMPGGDACIPQQYL